MTDEVKGLTREKDHYQGQVAKLLKKEDKMKHDLENNSVKLKEVENEANLLHAQVERQERELKQRDASSKSDNVRLTRQEEQINKIRLEGAKLHETNSVIYSAANIDNPFSKSLILKEFCFLKGMFIFGSLYPFFFARYLFFCIWFT